MQIDLEVPVIPVHLIELGKIASLARVFAQAGLRIEQVGLKASIRSSDSTVAVAPGAVRATHCMRYEANIYMMIADEFLYRTGTRRQSDTSSRSEGGRVRASAAAREAARWLSARVWPGHVCVMSSALLGVLLFFSCAHSLTR